MFKYCNLVWELVMHKNKVHTQSFFPSRSRTLYKPLLLKILHLIETSFLQLYVSFQSTGYATNIQGPFPFCGCHQQGSELQWASTAPSQAVLGKVIAHFSAHYRSLIKSAFCQEKRKPAKIQR